MIDGQSVIGVIPARGESKRVPRKNIREVGGKPLLEWTTRAALQSKYLDKIVLSTDSLEIKELGLELGIEVPFLRPPELSDDFATSAGVVRHALEQFDKNFDILVLLQPTTPQRTVDDIDACIELLLEKKTNTVLSVSEPNRSPYVMFEVGSDGALTRLVKDDRIDLRKARTQDFPPVYAINGAVYVVRVPWFLEHGAFFEDGSTAYITPIERSLNIDTEFDMQLGDFLLRTAER